MNIDESYDRKRNACPTCQSDSHEHSSDYASDVSSAAPPTGYETPPSRISTPQINTDNETDDDTDMTLPHRPVTTLPPLWTSRHIGGHGEGAAAAQTWDRLDNMSPPTPGHDDAPYIRFALEQITLNEEVMGVRHSVNSASMGNPQVIPAAVLAQHQMSGPTYPLDQPRQPRQPFGFPSPDTDAHRVHSREPVLVPVDPPAGGSWSRLGFVPHPLRLGSLVVLLILCLLMIAAIIFSNVYALRNNGIYDYDGNATPRYFIFQYLPQILGVIILWWVFVIQAAIYRVLPYFCMSTELDRDRVLQEMPIVSANFVWPDLRLFRLGEPLVGLTLLVFWLMNFTIPLLSCLYQTQYYVQVTPARWRWSTVQALGWFLVAWYFLLISALLYCMIRFRRRNSALMWDPASLADTILLFQRSNILTDYARSEVEPDLKSMVPSRLLRLGFWRPSGTQDVYHTVGQANTPLNRLSLQAEQSSPPRNEYRAGSSESFDVARHRYSNGSDFTRNIHSPFQRYRWCPWFLRDSCVLAWITAATLLLIAFLVVSFVNHAVRDGFAPLLPSSTRSNGFSPSNFLYSFLPALLGMWLFLFWQPIDTYFRSVQPYANLASPHGVSAPRSLLSAYTSMTPADTVVQALSNCDWKLAYITFVALLSTTIPVLAGGVFTAQLFGNGDVRMVASMPGYIALCIFVSIYALSYLIIWPTRKRYLPHPIDTIAGQLSFLYASPLLNDPAIRNVKTKDELVSRLSGVGYTEREANSEKRFTGEGRKRARERGRGSVDREPRYALGIHIGRDGKEHLGIDRLQRPGSGEMLVTTGQIRPSRSFRSNRI